MYQRGIDPNSLAQLGANGEVIADYPEERIFPSSLLLGFHFDQPVHAFVAHDTVTDDCYDLDC